MAAGKKIAIGVGIAIAALIAITAAAAFTSTAPKSPPQAISTEQNKAASEQSFAPKQESLMVVDGMTKVEKGGFVVIPLTVPKGATNAHFAGNFTSDTGIKVFVADKTILDQWKQGKRVFFSGSVYYTSLQQVNSGSVQIPEGGGVWSGIGEPLYLVFDNTDDHTLDKEVNAKLELSYTTYVRS